MSSDPGTKSQTAGPVAAVRGAATTQLPLEDLCMHSSPFSGNRFCFETFFRQLRASAREKKKIETKIQKRKIILLQLKMIRNY